MSLSDIEYNNKSSQQRIPQFGYLGAEIFKMNVCLSTVTAGKNNFVANLGLLSSKM